MSPPVRDTDSLQNEAIPSSGKGRTARVWPAVILIVAFLLRAVFVLQYSASPFHAYLTDDEEFEELWGWSIASGAPGPYDGMPYYRSPGYAYFVAAVYAVAGRQMWLLRIVQVVLGALTVAAFYWAGRKWLNEKAGIAAAAIVAVYAPFIVYTDCLVKETLVLLITILLIGSMFDALRSFGLRAWAICGLLCGLTMILRGNGILFAPIFGVALFRGFIAPERRSDAIKALIAVCLCGAVPVLPVAVRNYRAGGGDFVLVRWDTGPNLYFGNSHASSGAGAAGAGVSTSPWTEHVEARKEAEATAGRPLKASEVSAYFSSKAFRFIRNEPFRWARRLPRKLLCFLNAVELPDPIDISGAERYASVLNLPLAGYTVMLSLGLAGIFAAPGRRGERHVIPGLFALHVAAVLMFYVTARYRFPSIPFLALAAGGLLCEMPGMIRERRFGKIAMIVAGAIATAVIAHLPYVKLPPGLHDELAARIYVRHEQWASAADHYRALCAARPDEDEPYLSLAQCLYELGRIGDALRTLKDGATRCPDATRLNTMIERLESSIGRDKAP
ncbi:MAG TPA: glycosyltransferase family 39 protein [Candidatus Brocadiia bacterium]|nr:glycosyltransferase family 39 protein [Candidatus Brocadiia bacterium]